MSYVHLFPPSASCGCLESWVWSIITTPARIMTSNPRFRKPLHCPTELGAHIRYTYNRKLIFKKKFFTNNQNS